MNQDHTPTTHPPRPDLYLRVGLVGHRWDRMSTLGFSDLVPPLKALFTEIESACVNIHTRHTDIYSSSTANDHPCELSLVTGLAEGADQAGVAAMPTHWTLDAILAMPLASFKQHLRNHGTGDASQRRESLEFLDATANDPSHRLTLLPEPTGSFGEPSPFERLRDMLLRNVDVLVAVWDENTAGSGVGGTADAISLALKTGLAVIVLPLRNGELAAPYLLENIDRNGKPVAANRRSKLIDEIEYALDAILCGPWIFEPEGTDQHHEVQRSALTRAKDFFDETRKRVHFIGHYKVFKGYFDRSWAHKRLRTMPDDHPNRSALERKSRTRPSFWLSFEEPDKPTDWDDFLQGLPAAHQDSDLRARMSGQLRQSFGWTDQLANHYSDAFRSSYIVTYLLSALAVAIAIVSLFIPHDWSSDAQLNVKAVLVLLELIVLGWIWLQVWRARRGAWHERWLDYRALAETLRQMRSLALVGAHSQLSGKAGPLAGNSAWVVWYAKAIVRQIGLPGVALDQPYLEASVQMVEAREVDPQIEYNLSSETPQREMHHFLHIWGDRSFVLATSILGLFLLVWAVHFAQVAIEQGAVESRPAAPIAEPGTSQDGVSLHNTLEEEPGASHAAAGPGDHGQDLGTSSATGDLLYDYKLLVAALAALLPAFGAALAGIRAMGDFEGSANRAAATRAALEHLKSDHYRKIDGPTLETTASVLLDTSEVLAQDLGIWQALYGQRPLTLPA